MLYKIRTGEEKNRGAVLLMLFFSAGLVLFCSSAFAFCFEEAGKAYDINPLLLQTIAKIESNLKPDALNKNPNGTWDIGLMQVNSLWIKILGLNANELVSNPCYNAKTGAKILRQCINKYGYTWEAVGCYNATTDYKRVRYSWKVFNSLKAEGLTLESKSKNAEFRGSQKSASQTNSELSFKVKDSLTGIETSVIKNNLQAEAP